MFVVITRVTNNCIWFLSDDDETLLRDYAKHFDTLADAMRCIGANGCVIEADAILTR